MSLVLKFIQFCYQDYCKQRQSKLQRELVDAIAAGDIKAVERACAKGANPNGSSPYGSAPAMHFAVNVNGRSDLKEVMRMIEVLKRYGGDIDVKDPLAGYDGYHMASYCVAPLLWPQRFAIEDRSYQEGFSRWLASKPIRTIERERLGLDNMGRWTPVKVTRPELHSYRPQ